MQGNVREHLDAIARRIDRDGGAVVLLDFDGTLAPLKPTPDKARMSAAARRALERCAKRFPVAIVTGRAVSDVRKLVRVHGLSFAGNHGIEWFVAGKHHAVKIPRSTARALRVAYRSLRDIERRYHGAFVEDKKYSIAFHYRLVRPALRRAVTREVRSLVQSVAGNSIRIISGIFILNILPNTKRDKGTAVRMLMKRLKKTKRAVPIFIGDDLTDENAFLALRHGITIRIGKSTKSAARYYLRNQRGVERFLILLSKM